MRRHHLLSLPRSLGLRAVVAVLLVGGLFGMHGLAGHDGGVVAVAPVARGSASHMVLASPPTSQDRPMPGPTAPDHAPAGHTLEGPAPSGHQDHAPHPMAMGLCLAVLTLGLLLLLLLLSRPGSTLVANLRRVVPQPGRPSDRPYRPPPSLHALSVLRC